MPLFASNPFAYEAAKKAGIFANSTAQNVKNTQIEKMNEYLWEEFTKGIKGRASKRIENPFGEN